MGQSSLLKCQGGVALIEVLISLSIILFVVIGLQEFYISMNMRSLQANRALVLASAAQSILDHEQHMVKAAPSTFKLMGIDYSIESSSDALIFKQNEILLLEFKYHDD